MYQALYRTERPEVFGDVLGQEHVVKVLRRQIATDTVGHAYLFCGTRGTGKTTMARLLAKAVNCTGAEGADRPCGQCPSCQAIKNGTFLDMIEIDAASNNGVDNVRELRESVSYPPSAGKRKVYVIDEVHMLTVPAFNALLKTLEEPPENVLFILATTDPQKLPQTIISRCLRFDFRRVPADRIAARMKAICESRGVTVSDGALKLLAANADGSVRDGLSLLDQCLSGCDGRLEREDVLDNLGTMAEEFYLRLTEQVLVRDTAGALLLIDEALRDGKDARQLLADWLAHYRSLLIARFVRDPEEILNMAEENIARLKEQSAGMELADITAGITTIARTMNDARYSPQPRTLLELAVVTLAAGLEEGQPQVARTVRQVRKINEPAAAGKATAAQAAPQVRAASAPGPGNVPSSARGDASGEKAERPRTPAQAPTEDREAPEVPAKATDPAEKTVTDVAGETAPAASTDVETESAPAAPAAAQLDPDEVWDRMWDALGDENGSLFLVRMNAVPAGINATSFRIACGTDLSKEIAEKNRNKLTEALVQATGENLKLIIAGSDAAENAEADAADDAEAEAQAAARKIEEVFSIKPRIVN
ncbi:MAG: DNA polymerase III subunit gamma/tau [Firmicutes bacterium]|nr:DNA polymerase III subunit gamma/tau [Bacillota bacterium]